MKKNVKKIAIMVFVLYLSYTNISFAQNNSLYEIDTLRAELACIKDKNSPQYIKTKQKLQKIISHNKIDYSLNSRLNDVQRLIQEQKYNSAKYELEDLISNGYELSICYELLGDISYKCAQAPKDTAKYYKESVKYNPNNINATYKLAKIYLKAKKNIIGIEYLKKTIEKTTNTALLNEIERIILNNINPQSRYEANNLYEALGEIYDKLNRPKDAYIAYTKALQLNPEDIFIKYHLADLYFLNNENSNAIALYNSILEEHPNDTQIRTSKAKSLIKAGNLQSANQEYNIILSANPDSKQAKYGIYKIYENTLPPDEILRKVYSKSQNYIVGQKECLDFAKLLEDMGDTNASSNFKQYALYLDKIEKEKYLAQKRAQEQEILRKKKLEEQKQLELKKQQEEKLRQEQLKQEQLKKAQEEKLRQEQLKQEQLKKQQEEKLRQEQLKQEEKRKLEEQKRLKLEQEQKKKEELERQKKQKELEQKAILEKQKQEKLKQEQLKKAQEEKLRQEQLKKDEEKKKNQEKYNKLKADIDKYLKTEPKDAQIYTAIANTYKQMNEKQNALKYYKEALKKEPANPDTHYNIALMYVEMNSFESAKNHLEKSINLSNNNTKAINLLKFVNQKLITHIINTAYGQFENKKYIEAIDILNKGIEKYPKNAQLYYYRALVCDAMNRNAAQIIDLQKAIEFDPGYYMAYYQLGKAYEKIKDERSALVAYERFLSIEPDEKDLVREIQKKVVILGAKYY